MQQSQQESIVIQQSGSEGREREQSGWEGRDLNWQQTHYQDQLRDLDQLHGQVE